MNNAFLLVERDNLYDFYVNPPDIPCYLLKNIQSLMYLNISIVQISIFQTPIVQIVQTSKPSISSLFSHLKSFPGKYLDIIYTNRDYLHHKAFIWLFSIIITKIYITCTTTLSMSNI